MLYELREIKQVYGSRVALDLPYLDIERGEVVALTGPNGSGKSTLLRMLAFLEKPASGSIIYNEKPGEYPINEVTLLLQEPYLFKTSVYKNVAFGLKMRGDTDNLHERVFSILTDVGFEPADVANRRWYELSGGEKQRVALAARLILKPVVLLLDEPTSNLDAKSTEIIHDAVIRAYEDGTTVVAASHDRDWLKTLNARSIKFGVKD